MPRVIYSLLLELVSSVEGAFDEIVVPVDHNGQSEHCKPVLPKTRIIDLRSGDQVRHLPSGQTFQIKGVKAYRDCWDPQPPATGCYVVCRKNSSSA